MSALLAIAVAGAAGALCRALLDDLVSRRAGPPWGLTAVNLLGSLGAGLLAGAALRGVTAEALRLPLAVGFLGAFTTFSTWMVQTVALLEGRRIGRALLSLASLPLGAAAAMAGLVLLR